ncbi:MAG: type II toxin-antitoxin system prevent-host-death family antitoxin [Sulfuricellaceae bacterium]
MRTVSLVDAKAHFSELLNTVEAGEEIVVTRYGCPVARISPAEKPKQPLPLKRLAALRNTLPAWTEPSVKLVQQLRELE